MDFLGMIQDIRDRLADERPAQGVCYKCKKQTGTWSLIHQDFICPQCVEAQFPKKEPTHE